MGKKRLVEIGDAINIYNCTGVVDIEGCPSR
jgi:hypothetical protein